MSSRKITATLAVGPMSPETIEAVFRYSHFYRKQLMLIASKNQIDYAGGYVNNWTTAEYMAYINEMKALYPQCDVIICRDHCGPGFNGNHDLKDTYATIEADIKAGFDLIHIDFCHFKGTREERLEESKKVIEYCYSLNPDIMLEIGTDENLGTSYSLSNIDEITEEIDFFKSFCTPEFFVVQTGTIVKEIGQAGSYNADFTKDIASLLKTKGLKLKEHNADYLTKDQIGERAGVVDAMNNAPQFGVVQTSTVLQKCLVYGIKFNEYLDEVYSKGKWKKWMDTNGPENKMICFLIAGHYHFASPAYKNIIAELEKREDIKETIIGELSAIINHYVG